MTTPRSITVRVPATSANLGPGFDALGLALDLWNETSFEIGGDGITVDIMGEGSDSLPRDAKNMVARALAAFYEKTDGPLPTGLRIHCDNRIPLGSGLGSSAATILSGLAGANALLARPASPETLLSLAADMEGHADNAAAAALGGLVVAARGAGDWITRRYDLPPLAAAVVVPVFHLPTRSARAALPQSVTLGDAVFNIGRVGLVVEALRSSDFALLRQSMDDRLHQPYRLALIPGAAEALQAAANLGAAAALSGAGPGVIAFGAGNLHEVAAAMQAAFEQAGLKARAWVLPVSNQGLSEMKK